MTCDMHQSGVAVPPRSKSPIELRVSCESTRQLLLRSEAAFVSSATSPSSRPRTNFDPLLFRSKRRISSYHKMKYRNIKIVKMSVINEINERAFTCWLANPPKRRSVVLHLVVGRSTHATECSPSPAGWPIFPRDEL